MRLRGRIDAIDRATGEKASICDTASEPGGDLGVPARDAQTILGHTRISTTLEIYTAFVGGRPGALDVA